MKRIRLTVLDGSCSDAPVNPIPLLDFCEETPELREVLEGIRDNLNKKKVLRPGCEAVIEDGENERK